MPRRKNKNKKTDACFDIEYLKRFMKLSGRKKLQFLEELNAFLFKAIPLANKRIWQKLKKNGW